MFSRWIKGVIFDLDGVVTKTATVHSKAWKRTFDEYLKQVADKNGTEFVPFEHEADYLPYVDGKPRYDGVKSFLESRDINLPFGENDDAKSKETVCGIGNRKNDAFRAIIDEEGVEYYDTTINFVKRLQKEGIRLGVASSSKNCQFILETTGLIELFETVVDGNVSKDLGLAGKPAPDIFIRAAANMGLKPNECMMVEDAISGVQAGKAGNFALVLGLAREIDTLTLKAMGADIAVNDMGDLTDADYEKWFTKGIEDDGWNLTYYGFEPKEEKLRETLTTVGNGYFATRGCFVSERCKDDIHYPGTYVAGLYNKLPTEVHGRTLYNNDFVNCPNWLLIEAKIGDGDFESPFDNEVIDYRHNLNMKDAVLERLVTYKDKSGRLTTIKQETIISMHNPHFGALRYTIIPKNYSETITLKSTIDGNLINDGVPRYRSLSSKHIELVKTEVKNKEARLQVKTNVSNIDIFVNAKTALFDSAGEMKTKKQIEEEGGSISELITIKATKAKKYIVEKLVCIYTSKDQDVPNPESAANDALAKISSYAVVFEAHRKVWKALWEKADFVVEGDRFSQKVLRLHAYHLLVTASFHNKQIDTGMPPRGLHGEAYRGHVFWDELYIFPFFNLRFPDVTKALLMYRYKRLDGAREYAKENGYEGAMYPWQTADGGDEETQEFHYNPLSDDWGPDLSRRQRHVSIAIAYNTWEYFIHTDDKEFLHKYGAEMMIEIMRFWSSIATLDKKDGRYHINGVMGPDEFHEKYHGKQVPGINDNAYTNVMVSWLMKTAIKMIDGLPENVLSNIQKNTGFSLDELAKWKDVSQKINVVISKEGIISQFDGYLDLAELDWEGYKKKYDNIHRMDRILKAEGDDPDKYKLAKQADVLMLFYVLKPEEVKAALAELGYEVGDALRFMQKNYDYYVHRTSHGSTLSHVVHAAILHYVPECKADMLAWFKNALKSDVNDTQGGTTSEGIHGGVMAGTIDIVVKSFAGVSLYDDYIEVAPDLPEEWNNLEFKLLHKDHWFAIKVTKDKISIKPTLSGIHGFGLKVNGKKQFVKTDDLLEFEI
jgi:beta-phosphoglucomutase family hydrolase